MGSDNQAAVEQLRGTAVCALDASGVVTFAEGIFDPRDHTKPISVGASASEVFSTWPNALHKIRDAMTGKAVCLDIPAGDRVFEVQFQPRREGGVLVVVVDATRQRRTDHDGQRVAQRLEEAQRVAHVGSFEWNIASNVVTWSDELHRIYGLNPGQFGGTFEAFVERVHREDLELTKDVVFEAFRNPGPFVYDHRVVRPDGTVRTLHTRGDVITDEHGKPIRMAGSCWDVTDLTEARQRLERSLSLVEATLNATADGILVVDRQGKAVAFNSRLLDLWELTSRDVDNRDFEELLNFVHDQLENGDACLATVRDMQAHPEAESFDSLRFLDGRFFERYSRPQRVGDEIVGRVWSYRDVTEREKILRRAMFLADTTRLLASLDVEPALDGVAHMAVPFLGDGCAVDLLEGGPRRLLVVSRDPARPMPVELNPAALTGRPVLYSAGLLSCMAAPLVIQGTVVGALSFVAAPTRRYTEKDLELAEELARRVALSVQNARLYRGAQEALKARDEFLSIAAHEIRGPLTSIRFAVQMMHQGMPHDALLKALDVIQREDRRLARFVDELLDLGRIRGSELHFDFEEVDFNEVIQEVTARLRSELTRSGSALSIKLEARIVGQWDRFRVGQIVTNLLTNAIKFGLGKPIEINLKRDQDNALLMVRDHGIGIPDDKKEQVFLPFERAVSARHYGGLGLGLHIARTIVDGLGGKVWLESSPGAGTTAFVTLPLKRSDT
jgi:PAS domain S-box-containing protein